MEADLKTAFRDEKFEDVKKLADELKKLDPENHVAERLLGKAEEAKADKLKEANADKIKALEVQIKQEFRAGELPQINKLADEIKELDPNNKTVKKIENRIENAKKVLEKQERKEKIKGLTAEIKELLSNEEWDKAKDKANELLKVDENNSFAGKTLKKVDKTKEAEVSAPKEAPKPDKEKKPGFFASLFKKKEESASAKLSSAKPSPPVDKKAEAPAVVMPKAEPAPVQPVISATPPAEPKKPVSTEAEPSGEEAPKEEVKPAVSPKSVVPMPFTPKAEPALPVEEAVKPAPAAPDAKQMAAMPLGAVSELSSKKPIERKEAKGNIFTKLFGKKEGAPKPTKSIIDTIVEKTGRAKIKKNEKKKAKDTEEGLLKFATAFLEFSIAFILISAGFFYAYNIDEQNRILNIVGIEENYASRLHAASQTLEEKKAEERGLNKEIQKYMEGYEDERRETIEKIVESRMDWPDILRKLNEVTESVYEKNALAQYVQYNNYSYNVETGQFSVSATLSDPLGKNLTKLAELEEAFMYYPKDKDNPDDETQPYFYGLKEFKSFSKTFDKTAGRYRSTFSLTIYTKEPDQ